MSDWLSYADPINATSNQKASPCTRPECIMWNLKGISILEHRETVYCKHVLYSTGSTVVGACTNQPQYTQPKPNKPVEVVFFGLQEVDCVFHRLGHEDTNVERVLWREIGAHHVLKSRTTKPVPHNSKHRNKPLIPQQIN